MNKFCKKQNAKSMSEPNLDELQHTAKSSQFNSQEKTKNYNTYSAQYSSPTAPNLRQIRNKICVNPEYHCSCFQNPPPCPQFAPPENDLWDLQYCRWWGWNWVKKRNQQINSRQNPRFTENKKGECRRCNRKKRHKQDDFFSWCNKLFKGGRKERPLQEKEKTQLQEMYDTPSTANSSFHPSCKSLNYRRECECCSRKTGQRSMSAIILQSKRRQAMRKCNQNQCPTLLYQNESSSSDECCPCTCSRLKKKPALNADESVEYLSLQMKCLQPDCDHNATKVCHRHCIGRTGEFCPTNQRRIHNKCCKYTEKPSCNRYHRANVGLVPRFVRKPCKCDTNCLIKHSSVHNNLEVCPRTKDYIIQFPFIRHKKVKCHCTCQCDTNCNLKTMLDKSSSCPNINGPKFSETSIYKKPFHNRQRTRNIADNFQDSVSLTLANGMYSSPISSKVYNFNPKLFSAQVTPRLTHMPNPKDITEKFAQYSNLEDLPIVDQEHKLIMAAVCEAIASTQTSDEESNRSFENLDQFVPYNYKAEDHNLYNGNGNIENLLNTDKFLKASAYNPLLENTSTASRIPLLKKRFIKSSSPSQECTTINNDNVKKCNSKLVTNTNDINKYSRTSHIKHTCTNQNGDLEINGTKLENMSKVDGNIGLNQNLNIISPRTQPELSYLGLFNNTRDLSRTDGKSTNLLPIFNNNWYSTALCQQILKQSETPATFTTDTENIQENESHEQELFPSFSPIKSETIEESLEIETNEISFRYDDLFRELNFRERPVQNISSPCNTSRNGSVVCDTVLDTNACNSNYSNALEPIMEETCSSFDPRHNFCHLKHYNIICYFLNVVPPPPPILETSKTLNVLSLFQICLLHSEMHKLGYSTGDTI